MKKLFMLIGVALGLTGPATAQTDDYWETPQPLKDYLYATDLMATGEFFDLNTAYTVGNDETITISEAATAYGIEEVFPFGESLATGTSLNDLFFGYDGGEWTSVTRTGDDIKTTVLRLNEINLTDFSFLEKKVTGLILSAAGGVYFMDDASGETLEMTLPDPLADLNGQSVQYAARGFIAKYTDQITMAVTSVPITKMADKPVGCMALCTDKLSGLKYLLVQYNLSVNSHALVYQIRIGDDGRVEYRIGKQDKTTGDEYYTFRIDLKREANVLSFGGSSSYAIRPVSADNEKSWWTINSSQTLEKRCISIYPKGGTINGTPSYTDISASVVLSDKSKEALTNVTSLLVFVTPRSSVTPKFANKAYAVGDDVENANDFRTPYRVVYNAKPANLDNISFVAHNLNPNEKYYLYAYLCKVENGIYTYAPKALVLSDGILTRPMETPANVTVGELNGNALPLTFTATTFKTLVMKSDSVQSCKPQGVLAAGDRDGHVIAILDKGATSYNVEMTPGEMTYLQMFAMTDDATPGYSSNFTLVPLYRQADHLPLNYTFSDRDEIQQSEDAAPILPPGLSTSMTGTTNAFYVTYPDNIDHAFYLASRKTAMTPAWPNISLPTFSGAKNVQATFHVKFYKAGNMGFLNAGAPDQNDSVCIEYRLNGGTWQRAGLFTIGNMPEAIANVYPLSVVFNCKTTDAVEVRYSYYTAYSSSASSLHAIASYEFAEVSDCEMPSGLKVLYEKTTDKTVVLTWNDNNVPATDNYIVSYQKYVAPASDDEAEDGGLTLAETDGENDGWKTQTVNTTKATLRNLENNAIYNIKVQAVCSFATSPASSQVQITVPVGMPYVEDMTFAEFDRSTNDYAVKPNVTVYKGEPGIEEEVSYLTPLGEDAPSWNARQSETGVAGEDPDALAVSTAQDEALLATPAIFVHKYVTPLPKTLTFKVNTYAMDQDGDITNGIDLLDEDLRLYVLVSANGAFSWNDTVASFDHNALKATAETNGNGGPADRGMDLSVKLDKFEGQVRIAFYFHNPNPFPSSNADDLPMFLEILGISFNYDGDVPCFPVDALKATDIDETAVTLTWEGEGEEYGITYYPEGDKTKSTTVYQDATEADLQTITIKGLTTNTSYIAEVVSYCTKGDHANGSIPMSVEFKTLRSLFLVTVNIIPTGTGTVKGTGYYFEGSTVPLTATPNKGYKFVAWKDGETELSKDTTYRFQMPGENVVYTAVFAEPETFSVTVDITPKGAGTVKGTGDYLEGTDVILTATAKKGYKFVAWKDGETELSKNTVHSFVMPDGDVAYTAVFDQETGNEDMVRAHFSVSAEHGQLIVRNLDGLMVKDIDIYSLTGLRINRFTAESREDLILPVDAEHALVFVRINTEKGVAVYKVYLH